MRLFIGIDLPLEIKNKITAALGLIKKMEKGWENPHDYHLTLLFIGELNEEKLTEVKELLKHLRFDPFQIETDALTFFNRRVLYLSFKNSVDLLNLKKMIDDTFKSWSTFETKKFIPHVTIKRWQRYEFKELSEKIKIYPLPRFHFVVNGLSLFESKKNDLNEKYHVIFKLKLQ